jgi:putative transposase
MLSALQLQALFQRKGFSRQAQRVIEQVRDSQPTRRVRGGRGNVTSLYPSRKMGVIIQAESHRVELPFVNQMEMDSAVHEYYDQPPAIKLLYRSKEGRQLGVIHTPDFFCLGEDWTGWVECKSEGDLVRLAEKSPHRYVRTEDGAWRCPPGEEHAAHVGLEYRVFSSAEIDWIFQANVEFLGSYLGTGTIDTGEVGTTMAASIVSIVTKRPGITLADLLEDSSPERPEANGERIISIATRDRSVSKGSTQKNADAIYSLIATGGLYVDLYAARLSEPYRVHVFRDQEAARAHSWRLETYIPSHTPARRISQLNLAVGAALVWDGQPYTIVNLGQTHTFLSMEGKRGAFVRLPNDIFAGLIEQGEVTSGEETDDDEKLNPEALELRQRASRHDEAIANERFAAIAPYLLPGDALPGQGQTHAGTGGHTQRGKRLPLRTLARHKANFKTAEQVYGCGYDGLLPKHWKKGNRDPKLPDTSFKIMDELIENQYETYKQQTKSIVYSKYCLRCESEGVQPASYKTFLARVRNRPIYEQELKRTGHRAAYASKPFHLEPDYTTPRQGSYPFHVVYMDHTQADAELVCSETGENLGRPYISFATDGYTKKILAVYATYDPPSYRSCMMLVREIVRHHGRMPSIAIVDGGREFHSTYFDTLLARNLCMKKTRPPAEPRFGSAIERIFDTTNKQFFHSIKGNTQVMKYVRQVTKGVNPKGHAIWNCGALYASESMYINSTNFHTRLLKNQSLIESTRVYRYDITVYLVSECATWGKRYISKTRISPSRLFLVLRHKVKFGMMGGHSLGLRPTAPRVDRRAHNGLLRGRLGIVWGKVA